MQQLVKCAEFFFNIVQNARNTEKKPKSLRRYDTSAHKPISLPVNIEMEYDVFFFVDEKNLTPRVFLFTCANELGEFTRGLEAFAYPLNGSPIRERKLRF
ncbi:hypothetical protein EVAR_77190_1 [Eumeta japonica]|uniref:Uncharacterized protein n=1 Tax=Eumeta variegata TaxID=151549 RepID=A0A4C1T5H0_EUMVA|nr:hypothetical protein EVAR_77190_1 [Eumeta japonica]